MPERRAFEPLVLTEDDAGAPNESTPLLSQQQQQQPIQRHLSTPVSLTPTPGSRVEVTSSSVDDDLDSNELVRHRSRLSSYPVLPEPEFTKKRDSVHIDLVENSHRPGSAGDNRNGSDSASKYMNIGSIRFWFVFTTILLGPFDTTLLARLLANHKYRIFRSVLRHNADGIKSSCDHFLLRCVEQSLMANNRFYDH